MSKLEELIQRYCPDGVEYHMIGEIAQVGTGSSNGNEAEDDGIYPFFIRSQTIKRKNDYEYDEEAIIIPGEGGIGDIFHYINGKYALHQRVYRIHFTTPSVNVKFAFYYMGSAFKQFILKKAVSATVTSIRKPMIEGFEIPIPPLPVQEEIVRVLDTFTELQAELQAELQKRLQQYNYYRDNLLSFEGKTDVEWKKLGDIADLGTGSHNTQDGLVEGEYPFYTRGSEILYLNDYDYDETAIITAGDGAGVGKVFHFVQGKYALHQRAYRIVPNEKIMLARFVYYYIGATFYNYIMKSSVSSSVVSIRKPMMVNYPIPVPSLEEQQKIVDILDKFYALTTDITAGLPAEIEARRKQYEYYRDQLLTFKQKA